MAGARRRVADPITSHPTETPHPSSESPIWTTHIVFLWRTHRIYGTIGRLWGGDVVLVLYLEHHYKSVCEGEAGAVSHCIN